MSEELRVALYARVSTSDKGQDVNLQLLPLREYCLHRDGWKVAGEYVDIGISGTKSSRPELDRLLHDARKRKIDVICVWRLDRFGRSLVSAWHCRNLGSREKGCPTQKGIEITGKRNNSQATAKLKQSQ